ncbi:unnamed protein product [Sphagnum jensenii]
MSMGMLIQPPVEQTPELLRDAGLVVLNIVDGIRLLLCKVCGVCLEPKPCQVHNHLLGHDNHRAPKRRRNAGGHRVTAIAPLTDFAPLFDDIEFTQLQDPRLERYTTSPLQELLLVVPGIRVINGYRCKADGCAYYSASKRTIANHRLANHFFLPANASCQPCQVQRLFRKVGHTAYFGVDHQNMELAGDPTGLRLKDQVRASLEAHECSVLNVALNPSIRELSPWLRVSRWHELAVNHIIPAGTPLDHIKQASVLPTSMNGEFNLDRLPSMVRAYLENAQTMIGRVPYHLRRLDLAIHLFTDWLTRSLFITGTNDDRSLIWNENALAMWARAADRMHALLFLLLHLTAGGPPRGEEYKSYLIRNTEHSNRTFYWSFGTIMTFQRYHKSANVGPPVKLIPRFLPPKLNLLFVEYMLLVRPVQSFVAGLRGNIDAT